MFPERLKELRVNKRLTQQDMADYLGITRQGYGKYESGQSETDIKTLKKLANFFNVTTDYLTGNSDQPSKLKDNPNPQNEKFNPMNEINKLLDKYEIEDSGFFDIEKWKAMGPDEIKQLEEYFEFITSRAKNKKNR